MQRIERNSEFVVPGNGRNGSDNGHHLLLMESAGGRGVRSRVEGIEERHSSKRSGKATRHTKRSPSERRFKCDQMGCDRMFFTRKDVKRHMVVHTGIRNFACPFCQQRFGRKDHLVRHAKKSHNRDTRSCATSFGGAHGGPSSRKNNPAVFKSTTPAHHPHQPGSSGMMPQMFSHVPTTSTNIAHPAAVHHHHLNNHFNYGSNGQSDTGSQLLLLTSSGSSSASTSYMSYNVPSLHETSAQFSASSLIHHENHDVPTAASSSVHQHQLTKVTSCDASGHSFFSFPMPPLASFAEHSLMQGCFTASASPSRSLYPTPGPSHHHHAFASAAHHGVNGVTVPGHHHPHHHHPSEPSAFSMDFNPQLPNFNQAFQQ